MTPFRILFLVLSSLSVLGAGYMGYYGLGGDSTDLAPSVRLGSGGNGSTNANVK